MYDRFEYNGTLTDYPARTEWYWLTHPDNDYSDFNFDYHTPEWESYCVQVFGDQHTQNSHTYLVNKKHNADTPWQYHEHTVKRTASHPVFHATNLQPEEGKGVRMFSNFFNFIKRCCNKTDADYFWVTSSVCNYNNFDFTWHPDIGEEKFIHAWTSPNNKYGYTFFVPRKNFLKQLVKLQKLEWFEYVKYHYEVPTNKLPINIFNPDTGCADAVKNHTFTHHYEWFIENGVEFDTTQFEPSRWDEINLECFGKNKTVMCVPREAKSFIVDQIYDYPHITHHALDLGETNYDIIFISYDEIEADKNYETFKTKFPRTKRLHGVKGMVNALKKAADMSDTGYYYAVFAKTKVSPTFNFDFQHDRLSVPSNYIFHCHNPVVNINHGAMGIILYNKDLVTNAKTWGLDFTISFPVKVIDQISCIAAYNVSPYQTWRTAFRECVKYYSNVIPRSDKKENKWLLDRWLTHGNGPFGEWSMQGAKDAITFVDSGANLFDIMDWEFLRNYFTNLHGNLD